jgi:hypothetical protein
MGCENCPEPVAKPQHAVRFKAWYTDGRVFEGSDPASWASLPSDGVLLVVVYFEDNTRRMCIGDDYYGAFTAKDGYWTIIHNSHTDNAERYPDVVWKRGCWASEAELRFAMEASLL